MSSLATAPSVLLAESDRWSAEMLVQLVRSVRPDADVTVCANSDDALLQLRRGPPDLVIADYSLPGQGGIELLRTVRRAKNRVVPFLVIKGRADVYSVRAALPLQPMAYLTEPFRAERVLSHVQTVLSGLDAPPPPASRQGTQSLDDYLQGLRGRAEGAPMLASVHQAISLLISRESDLSTVERVFCGDPQITARLIAAANSGERHGARICQTLAQALPRLGLVHSLNLALGISLQSSTRLSEPRLQVEAATFWALSQRTADTARWLATQSNGDADRCYTAGLLHCVGELTLLRALQDWINRGGELDDADVGALLRSYAAGLGAALHVHWRLPIELRELIEAASTLGGGVYARDALIVHFAARYSRAQNTSEHALLDGKAARMLGVTLEMLEGIPAAA